MTLQIPNHLRIHADDNKPPKQFAASDELSAFWQAYVDATGWRVDKSKLGAKSKPHLLPATTGTLDDIESADDVPAVSKSAAERLARAASQIADRLREFEGNLSRSEAEEAVSDIRSAGISTDDHIAERLDQVLHEAVLATGCDAAGLYLLDDDTSSLKLRSCYGLPKSKLADEPRQLRGSLGDLEALVSTVVTIEDISRMTHWESPEDRGAAVVVAIRGGELPLGTLWLWDDQPRDFTVAQEAAAKLAAGRIAAELEREVAKMATVERKDFRRELRDASAWQERQLPPPIPLAKNWKVSGWADPAKTVGGDWFAWDVLPNGSMAMAIASADSTGIEAALTSATARSAWQAHGGYRHKTNQMLSRMNDTLWQTSTGDQLTSIIYANIDSDTGEGEFATAGNCHAFVVNKYGYRAIASQTQPLGSDPDQMPETHSLRLLHGDALVLATEGIIGCNGTAKQGRLSQQELTDIIRDSLKEGPEAALTALRIKIADLGRSEADRSVAILVRE